MCVCVCACYSLSYFVEYMQLWTQKLVLTLTNILCCIIHLFLNSSLLCFWGNNVLAEFGKLQPRWTRQIERYEQHPPLLNCLNCLPEVFWGTNKHRYSERHFGPSQTDPALESSMPHHIDCNPENPKKIISRNIPYLRLNPF